MMGRGLVYHMLGGGTEGMVGWLSGQIMCYWCFVVIKKLLGLLPVIITI